MMWLVGKTVESLKLVPILPKMACFNRNCLVQRAFTLSRIHSAQCKTLDKKEFEFHGKNNPRYSSDLYFYLFIKKQNL